MNDIHLSSDTIPAPPTPSAGTPLRVTPRVAPDFDRAEALCRTADDAEACRAFADRLG